MPPTSLGFKLSAAVIVVTAVLSVAGPAVAPYPALQPVAGGAVWEVPFWYRDCSPEGLELSHCWDALNALRSKHVWLGTDRLGRDLLSLLLSAARYTMAATIVIVLAGFLAGLGLRAILGLPGEKCASVLFLFIERMLVVPKLVYALLFTAIAGPSAHATIVTLAVLAALHFTIRINTVLSIRADTCSARFRFGNKSRLLGEFAQGFASVLLCLSTLSFLGLGLSGAVSDWGTLARDNVGALYFGFVTPLIPAAAIMLVALACNQVSLWLSGTR